MFVMREDDTKDNAENQYHCFGIVIPDDLLQQYIQRWLDDLTKTDWIETTIDEKEDIKDNAENRYECFGIVIPDNLLQHYIKRWLKCLTKTSGLEKCIDDNRPLKNVAFRAALNDYLRQQLNTETIASLISDAEEEFLNKMFVMTDEDINEETANRPVCLSIVIPGDLFLQYIERWFKLLTKPSKLEINR
ncbi:unnamed protein product [Mytilus edulis]|uniref:Uncharacterized protein n=1 Tax=Mytilus edulis TaxID=6550 RepID=A0A8S3QV98_MYTED|nr:unnamed protein product [Mytilus edulis]